mmetsp:Transcript_40178/g.83680  ORF Transcript_40178/g.83680 Transcript_40178/m.83680 type:complete len:235 (+) Transcript_40178:824-1528(+)
MAQKSIIQCPTLSKPIQKGRVAAMAPGIVTPSTTRRPARSIWRLPLHRHPKKSVQRKQHYRRRHRVFLAKRAVMLPPRRVPINRPRQQSQVLRKLRLCSAAKSCAVPITININRPNANPHVKRRYDRAPLTLQPAARKYYRDQHASFLHPYFCEMLPSVGSKNTAPVRNRRSIPGAKLMEQTALGMKKTTTTRAPPFWYETLIRKFSRPPKYILPVPPPQVALHTLLWTMERKK